MKRKETKGLDTNDISWNKAETKKGSVILCFQDYGNQSIEW